MYLKRSQTVTMELKDCTYDNTKTFNFNGKVFEAKCVKVYDGDTITVVFKTGGGFYKYTVRMDGYDSPELRTENVEEKKWGLKSRDYLASMVLDKIVTVVCKNYDKYGRILAVIKIGNIDVNADMLKNGHCRKYDGGRKEEWDFSKFE